MLISSPPVRGFALVAPLLFCIGAVSAEDCSTSQVSTETCLPALTKSCEKATKGAEYAIRWDPSAQPAAPQSLKATLSALGISSSAADDAETRSVTYYTNVDRERLEVPDPNTRAIVRHRNGSKEEVTYKLRGGYFSCLCPFGTAEDFKPSLECDITVVGSPVTPDPVLWTCTRSFSCELPNGNDKDAKNFFGVALIKHEAEVKRVEYKPGAGKKLKVEAWTIGGNLRILEVSQNGDSCDLPTTFVELAVKPLLAAGVNPGRLSKEAIVTGSEN